MWALRVSLHARTNLPTVPSLSLDLSLPSAGIIGMGYNPLEVRIQAVQAGLKLPM